jgi:hypothetical protein
MNVTVCWEHYPNTGYACVKLKTANGEFSKQFDLYLNRHDAERERVVKKTIGQVRRLKLGDQILNYVIHQLDQISARQREWDEWMKQQQKN